jgi:hypothetical protein
MLLIATLANCIVHCIIDQCHRYHRFMLSLPLPEGALEVFQYSCVPLLLGFVRHEYQEIAYELMPLKCVARLVCPQ